jgi:hypothetical protein
VVRPAWAANGVNAVASDHHSTPNPSTFLPPNLSAKTPPMIWMDPTSEGVDSSSEGVDSRSGVDPSSKGWIQSQRGWKQRRRWWMHDQSFMSAKTPPII